MGKRPTKESLGIPYRGVSVNAYPTNEGWGYRLRSRIQKDGVEFYLGTFTDVEKAAKAYNDGARKYYTTKVAKKLGMWNVIPTNA